MKPSANAFAMRSFHVHYKDWLTYEQIYLLKTIIW